MKRLVSIFLMLCISFGVINVYAITSVNGHRISARVYKENNTICISGNITPAEEKIVSVVIYDSSGSAIYLNQTKSNSKGYFIFKFKPNRNFSQYMWMTAKIGCEGYSYPASMSFQYSELKDDFGEVSDPYKNDVITVYEHVATQLDLKISINKYVPTISGTITAEPENGVVFRIEDELNNKEIITWQTNEKGKCSFSYTFPSLLQKQSYYCSLGDTRSFSAGLLLDMKSLILGVSYAFYMDEDAAVYVDTNIMDKTLVYEDLDRGEYYSPNIFATGTYELKARFVDTFTEDEIHTISKIENKKLYNALISKYPYLDEKNLGVICSSDITGTNGVLDLSNSGISSLIGMQDAKINGIILDNNNIESLRPLTFIDGLTYISARNNKLKNVSNFGSNIEYMNLDGNNLTGLEGLQTATNLVHLSANNNNLHTANGLGTMTRLKYLGLDNNYLSNIHHLEGCEGLVTLNISNNNINDISALDNLNLIYMAANNNQITDLGGFSDNTTIKYLSLENNFISDFSCLKGCDSLVHLDVSDNYITDTSGLNDIKQLFYADLSGNPVCQ